jgi:hypothetical protein
MAIFAVKLLADSNFFNLYSYLVGWGLVGWGLVGWVLEVIEYCCHLSFFKLGVNL